MPAESTIAVSIFSEQRDRQHCYYNGAMRRGKRGSGRRRLRELTRSVVETMEILEEVREKHSGVGGMSKALTQVLAICRLAYITPRSKDPVIKMHV